MSLVEIFQSPIAGRGLRAARTINKGEVILRMSGKRVSEAVVDRLLAQKKLRRDNPLQIGGSAYIILDPVPVAANHSCDPNAAVIKTNTLVAIKTISEGEEITYDYACVVGTENEGWQMNCRCGSKKCRKKIGAWTTIPPSRFALYKKIKALPVFVLREMVSVDH